MDERPKLLREWGTALGLGLGEAYPVALLTQLVEEGGFEVRWKLTKAGGNGFELFTSDGSTELFSITYTFNTARTLQERFFYAVNYGEACEG